MAFERLKNFSIFSLMALISLAMASSGSARADSLADCSSVSEVPTREEAQKCLDLANESSETEAQKLKYFLQRDLGAITRAHQDLGEIHTELLKRSALNRLIRTAYMIAVLGDRDPRSSPIFTSIRVLKSRFPGLAMQLKDFRQKLDQYYSTSQSRREARSEVAQTLVESAVALRGIDKRISDLTAESNSKAKSDPARVKEISDELLALQLGANGILTIDPTVMILLLDSWGPKEIDPAHPHLAFDYAEPGKSVRDEINLEMDAGRSMEDITTFVENSISRWLPAWDPLLNASPYEIEIHPLQDLFKRDLVRDDALEAVEGTPLKGPIEALDKQRAIDLGFVPGEESSEEHWKNYLETAGFIISGPVGFVGSVTRGISNSLGVLYDKSDMTSGGFLGWSNHVSIEQARAKRVWWPTLVGTFRGWMGYVMRAQFGKWLTPKLVDPTAPMTASLMARLVATLELLKASPSKLITGPLGAAMKYAKANPARMSSVAAYVAGDQVVSAIFWKYARHKSSVWDLRNDPNYWRDMSSLLIQDSIMGFVGVSKDKTFMEKAFLIGSVGATSSFFGQYRVTGKVDWNRLIYDFNYSSTASILKYEKIFDPLARFASEKVKLFIGSRLAQMMSSVEKAGIERAAAASGLGTEFFIQMINNSTGAVIYYPAGHQFELKDLDEAMAKALRDRLEAVRNASKKGRLPR